MTGFDFWDVSLGLFVGSVIGFLIGFLLDEYLYTVPFAPDDEEDARDPR
jgi:F0F1-type ATP synthase assembly protein I